MKKKPLILVSATVLCLVVASIVSAQDKRIRLVKGHKLVLKSWVREGADKSYTFKPREGQQLTVKLISKDAVFTLYSSHAFDVETIKKKRNHGPASCLLTRMVNTELV